MARVKKVAVDDILDLGTTEPQVIKIAPPKVRKAQELPFKYGIVKPCMIEETERVNLSNGMVRQIKTARRACTGLMLTLERMEHDSATGQQIRVKNSWAEPLPFATYNCQAIMEGFSEEDVLRKVLSMPGCGGTNPKSPGAQFFVEEVPESELEEYYAMASDPQNIEALRKRKEESESALREVMEDMPSLV